MQDSHLPSTSSHRLQHSLSTNWVPHLSPPAVIQIICCRRQIYGMYGGGTSSLGLSSRIRCSMSLEFSSQETCRSPREHLPPRLSAPLQSSRTLLISVPSPSSALRHLDFGHLPLSFVWSRPNRCAETQLLRYTSGIEDLDKTI